MLRLTVFEISAFLKAQNFGFWGPLEVPPQQGEDIRDIYVPPAMPIGVTATEISVPLHKKPQQMIYDKTNTSIAFVI